MNILRVFASGAAGTPAPTFVCAMNSRALMTRTDKTRKQREATQRSSSANSRSGQVGTMKAVRSAAEGEGGGDCGRGGGIWICRQTPGHSVTVTVRRT
eukprot:74269-Rhodomonas_salina.1